jgi:hypothetical protein
MKPVVHLAGKLPESFLTQAVLGMRANKKPQPHDCSGKRSADAPGLTHAATETGTKLLGLLGRQTTVKPMIKHQQKGFRTAEPQIREKIFRPMFYKQNNLIVFQG